MAKIFNAKPWTLIQAKKSLAGNVIPPSKSLLERTRRRVQPDQSPCPPQARVRPLQDLGWRLLLHHAPQAQLRRFPGNVDASGSIPGCLESVPGQRGV